MLLSGRYVALVYDAEPDERPARSPQRFDALGALGRALNERTRCAAIALRAGGNRSGADSVLTSHTGYPMAVDFARGYPRYGPHVRLALTYLGRRYGLSIYARLVDGRYRRYCGDAGTVAKGEILEWLPE